MASLEWCSPDLLHKEKSYYSRRLLVLPFCWRKPRWVEAGLAGLGIIAQEPLRKQDPLIGLLSDQVRTSSRSKDIKTVSTSRTRTIHPRCRLLTLGHVRRLQEATESPSPLSASTPCSAQGSLPQTTTGSSLESRTYSLIDFLIKASYILIPLLHFEFHAY